MFFSRRTGSKLFDRGDPSALDFEVGDLTLNATWQDLDLSGIIPKGACSVSIGVAIKTSLANKWLKLRKKGNVNDINVEKIACLNDNQTTARTLTVTPNKDGIIQYNGVAATWSILDMGVRRWIV